MREEASRPYRIAHVTAIADVVAEADRPALRTRRQRLEALIRESGGRTGIAAPPRNISDEGLVNGISQLAHIDELDRERLLEAPNPLARADVLIAILEKSIAER
jgi:Lon protease-like protein